MCKYLNPIPILTLGTLLSIIGTGCATTEKNDVASEESGDTEKQEPSHYQLVRGEPVHNPPPLPSYIPFKLQVFTGSELTQEYLKYRGWDFNRDGIIDMLEELSPNGDQIGQSFDLDFNGSIDVTNKKS